MAFFPEELYEFLQSRVGDSVEGASNTKDMLEQGGPDIVSKLIEKSGKVAGAVMEQDFDLIVETTANLWYHSLVLCLYYGVSPDQVQQKLIEYHNKTQ